MLRPFIFLLAALCILVLIAWIYPYIAVRTSSILILNAANKQELPIGFRITPLNASASPQFSEGGLRKILEKLNRDNVIVVDLREEPHGYLNGNAVSWLSYHNWANQGKGKVSIVENENERIHKLSSDFFTIVFKDKQYPIPYFISSMKTEEELAHDLNVGYYRLPITDHVKPSDKTVDEFIVFIKNLPEKSWLHFHCSAGKGRASTMLTMLDMMHRANELTFNDFINRQVEFGGINLLTLTPGKDWKYGYLRARAAFLEQFHHYCQEEAPQFKKSWSGWKDEER